MSSPIHDKAQPRPTFSTHDAARLAQVIYGLTGSVKELTSERDQNFLVTTEAGEQLVLKIAAAAEQRETLEFQNAVMARLGERIRSGFIPQLRKTKAGDDIASVGDENQASHFVRVLTYHPSPLLAQVNPHASNSSSRQGRFVHCGDACVFLGPAGKEGVEAYKSTELLDSLRTDVEMDEEQFQQYLDDMDKEYGPTAYVFQCLHCGLYLRYSDRGRVSVQHHHRVFLLRHSFVECVRCLIPVMR